MKMVINLILIKHIILKVYYVVHVNYHIPQEVTSSQVELNELSLVFHFHSEVVTQYNSCQWHVIVLITNILTNLDH